jgi:hypothetical protein
MMQSSDIKSRNSIHPDGLKAAQWINAEFKRYGFTSELETFRSTYNPNVIATLKGSVEPDTIVVIGAHYDSRGVARESATADAPGADDDGSGTQALLQLARIISEYVLITVMLNFLFCFQRLKLTLISIPTITPQKMSGLFCRMATRNCRNCSTSAAGD